MIRPTGGLVRNDEAFQRAMSQLQQVASLTSSFPIDVQKNGESYHIRWVPPPPMLVRITGHATGGSGSGYTTLPENHYTGFQQLINVGDSISHDANAGVEFTSGFPLIEVNGVTTVPVDTVVYATPAIAGTHYEFVYGTGARLSPCDSQSGSGSGSACCRLQLSDIFRVVGDECQVADGCFQIVDENGNAVNLFLDFVFDAN